MTHGSADTIITSISSADDDDVFTFGVDVPAFFELGVKESLGVQLRGESGQYRESAVRRL
jgi:hypothetical protein